MKYLKLTTSFLILLTIQTFSQESSNRRFKIGLNLGINQSDLKESALEDYDKVISYSFGISSEYKINEKLSLFFNLNYDNKMMKLENFRVINFNNNETYFVDNKIIFNYLNAPLNVRYYFGKRNKLFADAGVFYNHFLNVKNKTTRKDTEEEITAFLSPNVKKYDYGILIGLGYMFYLNEKNCLSIFLRDEFGIPNIMDYPNNPNVNIKTNTIKLILNWQIII
ncbi:porin family protein [Seonamhaeicola marinus]|uniref:PorT family protein n=1 Tax=Seonamhaeicola marinus TaxID=1912246 RepID=A0A5D0HSU3_9FLAO|nr:porin family protein [Seonamhaeicola marinus]TYA74335.1 PorT family protein [Seonamhaeicola marinus]